MYGQLAKTLRIQLNLKQKELAKMAKVSKRSVQLFENNEPLVLAEKRKILSQLYAEKAKKMC